MVKINNEQKATRKNVFSSRFLAALQLLCVFFLVLISQIDAQNSPNEKRTKNFDLSLPLQLCWENKNSKAVKAITASDNAVSGSIDSIDDYGIFIATEADKIENLELKNGRRLWVSDLGGMLASNIAGDEKNLFMTVKINEGYYLRNISKNTGLINWQTILKFPASDKEEKKEEKNNDADTRYFDFSLYADVGKIILAARNGDLYAFEGDKGELIWRFAVGNDLSAAAVFTGDKTLAATLDRRLSVVSNTDGKLSSVFETTADVTSLAAASDGRIYFGDKTGVVISKNTANNIRNNIRNNVWKARVGGAQISDITITTRGLLVSSFDNFIYLLSANNGKRIWKRRLPGRIAHKPTIAGAYAVVNTANSRTATIIELGKGSIVNKIILEEEDNFFTEDDVVLTGNRILFSTRMGLKAFAVSFDGC